MSIVRGIVGTGPRTYERSLRSARQLARYLRQAVSWFLVLVVLAAIVVGVFQATVGGFHDGEWNSIWEFAEGPMRYFPLALGIIFTTSVLPAYVANGVTRSEFTIGAALVTVGVALVMATAGAVGLGVEKLIFDAAGQPQNLAQPHLFANAGDVLPILAEFALLAAIHIAYGWTLGVLFYQFGPWIGMILLLIAVLPVAAVEALLSVSWFGKLMIDGWGIDRQPLPLVIPACLAIIGLTFYVNYLLTRRLAIRP